jgi:hypothetical protein
MLNLDDDVGMKLKRNVSRMKNSLLNDGKVVTRCTSENRDSIFTLCNL